MPIIDPVAELPDAISEAFRGRAVIPAPEIAKLFGLHPVTLREHIRAGNLPWRSKGIGKVRPRRVFARSDAEALWQYMTNHPMTTTTARETHVSTSRKKRSTPPR